MAMMYDILGHKKTVDFEEQEKQAYLEGLQKQADQKKYKR